MSVIKFLIDNWDFLLLIILAVSATVYFIFKGNKSVIMEMLVSLVTEAEKNFGAGTGVLKLATVIDAIYPKLPTVIKAFISDATLTRWVEEALNIAKEKWRTNTNISAYIAENNMTAINDISTDEKSIE